MIFAGHSSTPLKQRQWKVSTTWLHHNLPPNKELTLLIANAMNVTFFHPLQGACFSVEIDHG